MGLATCFSPSIACSGKQFLTLLPYWVNLRLGLAICTHALTIFWYVLQFLSLEIIREKISKAEGNDAMFNWEIYWLVKRIDNSTDSQIRLRCQNESEVSASGFLKKPFFSCEPLQLVELCCSYDNTDTSSSSCTEQLALRPSIPVTTRFLALASDVFANTKTSPLWR